MQGHRPGMQPVPPGMISASVVNGLTFTPYAIFGQDMNPTGATAPPQPQPGTSAAGPSPPPRVQPEGAPSPWQGTTGIAPSQTHLNPPPPPNQEHLMHRPPPWDGYSHNGHPGEPIPGPSAGEGYEYRYRDDDASQWVPTQTYYDPGVCEPCPFDYDIF